VSEELWKGSEAVRARCTTENVDCTWIFDESIRVVVAGTATVIPDNVESHQGVFRVVVSDDGNGEIGVDFLDSKAPLSALVKIFIATVQRRGQLDIKTGGGTYLSVTYPGRDHETLRCDVRTDLTGLFGRQWTIQYDPIYRTHARF
jgi:hypothetical protein